MAQNFTNDSFAGGHVGQTDLQNMENNFTCLKTMFSGAAAPANLMAGMPWFDTGKKVQKQRNAANSAWIGLLHGDAAQKLWIYRNTGMDGFVIDSAVSDRVLALKGGAGLYNVSGGTVAGETWANLKAHAHSVPSHAHGAGSLAAPDHTHTLATSATPENYDPGGGTAVIIDAGKLEITSTGSYSLNQARSITGNPSVKQCTGATAYAGTGNTGAQSTADVRPAAAVGTLQYLDL